MIELPILPLTTGVGLLLASTRIKSLYSKEVTKTLGVFVLFAATFALATDWVALGCVLRDDWLLAADTWLGVDARAISDWFNDHRWAERVSKIAYFSFVPQIMLALLMCGSRLLIVKRMILAAAITLVVFAFVPAIGNYDVGDVGAHNQPIKERMEALSAGDVPVLRIEDCEGIICAPSFHTIVGVLLIIAFWQVNYLRWYGVILNVLMIISTVPTGGHYVVDVLAGIIVAILCLTSVRNDVYL